jgi:hypothetical protein
MNNPIIQNNFIKDNNYNNKYNKYKNKYIQLKLSLNQIGGKNLISKNIISNILTNIVSNSYSIFELNYSDKNKKTIENMKINMNLNYDFFGSIDNFISNKNNSIDSLNNYIIKLGQNDIKITNSFIKIIKNLAKVLSLGYNKKFFWLTIRTVMPNDDYIIPRWHCDGNYFDKNKYPESQTKFVTIFKGPGTLLLEKNKDVKETYIKYKTDSSKQKIETIEERTNIDLKFKDIGAKTIQLNKCQGLIFLSGNIDNCTIHSEPNITEPRIFLSIVFADELNINDWKEKKMFNMSQNKPF